MTYTLVVSVKEAGMSASEIDAGFDSVLRDITLFRKGQTPEDLYDAMDFWTGRGFHAAIYRDLEDFANDS